MAKSASGNGDAQPAGSDPQTSAEAEASAVEMLGKMAVQDEPQPEDPETAGAPGETEAPEGAPESLIVIVPESEVAFQPRINSGIREVVDGDPIGHLVGESARDTFSGRHEGARRQGEGFSLMY